VVFSKFFMSDLMVTNIYFNVSQLLTRVQGIAGTGFKLDRKVRSSISGTSFLTPPACPSTRRALATLP